ncbi:MAG: hypothetical protein K2K76_05765 [Muribaculaceae bacterium]|nr:hypothetical protein [Muribaculaceae bacterium]
MRSHQSCGAATQLKKLTAYYLCVILLASYRWRFIPVPSKTDDLHSPMSSEAMAWGKGRKYHAASTEVG